MGLSMGIESRNVDVMIVKNGTEAHITITCNGATLKDSDVWGNRRDTDG